MTAVDIDGDGRDEIALGGNKGGAVRDATGKQMIGLQGSSINHGQQNYSMLMLDKATLPGEKGERMLGVSASVLRMYDSGGKISREVDLAFSPAGLHYDPVTETLLLGSGQSGGDCVYCVRILRPGWQLALENVSGSSAAPVVVDSYGEGSPPVIDGAEVTPAVSISSSSYLQVNNLSYIDNELKDIGGPGIQPGGCRSLVLRGNKIDHSGSTKLDLMFGRGSGAWIHSCSDVLVEHNVFMNASGINDSCGFHTDAWNNNVLVQYNLSVHNAGGFVEILGNNRNTVYRYNMSINDGWRVEGEKHKRGECQNSGSILWLSGFVPGNQPRKGPFNSYIYNNTVFVAKEQTSFYSLAGTTDGVLIANNIFYFLGPVETAKPKQMDLKADPIGEIDNVVFRNNVYRTAAGVPDNLKIKDANMIIGEPDFAKPGGLDAKDYTVGNTALIKDKGIKIEKLPGDEIGIKWGLEVKEDFFGNPIVGMPDLGAIEIK